ncbi:efflux RND transporter permease subunit [Paenibacillus aurantius]|uniref:Efflux RND transporter permease subunit n=1 Tax=Paenibacillus aurantius TaxID=2918900 RepID=A0AA96LC58_9BACL|nr:efflux RND transporter permease subunit [Paenibacillus aurantius]WNQ10590.1 efflux RND transporter permease subunit [Paenibacillus aurantius]
MKGIIRFSLTNKFAIWILTLIVTAAGLYSGFNMKQETLPNISLPYLVVTTVYPGAAPEGVVEQVTKPLEQRLKNLDGLKNLNSNSMENVSSLTLEYNFGTDMDKAMNDIRQSVDAVKLPQGAQKPEISKISFNSFPVISVSAAGGKDLEELTRVVEEEFKPALEGVPGVASVSIAGQYLKEVQLTFNKEKLQALGLSEETVKGIVQGSAVKVPLGIYELDKSDKAVVVDGRITTLDGLKNLAIPVIPGGAGAGGSAGAAGGAAGQGAGAAGSAGAMPGAAGAAGAVPGQAAGPAAGGAAGQGAAANPVAGAAAAGEPPAAGAAPQGIPTVKLSELADIQLVGKAESISRTNQKESVGLQIVKANDANTVEVVNGVKEEIRKFNDTHKDLQLVVLLDQGKPIEESVATMLNKALFGALFAVLIILLFLRNLRTTLISIISIPLSLLIAVLLLQQMDITLNIMTLGAMTVAIGRVVDDSIVVIENIYRRMSLTGEKLSGKELILESTREMFVPIMSSTIVTIAVFLPLGTVSGMVGELFLPFALTIVFALLASLLVAVTVVPMLAHSLFRRGLKKKHTDHDKPGRLAGGYRKVLNWSLNHKLVTFLLAVALLVGSLFLIPKIGVSFLPDQEDKYVMVTYSPAPGERLEDVEKRALEAEKLILERPGVENLQYSVGGKNPFSPGPSKSALFYAQYKSDTKDFDKEKKAVLEALRTTVKGGGWKEMEGGGGVGGSKLELSVYGETLEAIKPVTDQITELMKGDSHFEKVDTSLSKTYDQYTLVADQQKLSSLGLTAGQLAMKLAPVRETPSLTSVTVDGKSYNVYVQADGNQFQSIADIENTTLTSPLGIQVPIKDVAKVEKGTSPNAIERNNNKMVVKVSADITAKDVNKASNDLKAKVDELQKPAGVEVQFGGVAEQILETFTQLGLAMAAAIAIVYLVLVITFGGALAPFAIMFSLPFTVIGGLVGLLAAGESLSVSAMMGALMLIGIVVTNAIVLIDRVIHKEKEGLTTREALLEAGSTRLRPILMTALATIGALLPLAFGFESAGIISKGLGVTVIGGLVSSTLLTLLIVPIVYEFLMKFSRRKRSDRSAVLAD